MKIDLNKVVSSLIILLGHIFFLLYAANDFSIALIIIFATFLSWIIWGKVTNDFILNQLLYLIALSGFLVSLSILFIYGVEPIGTRNGILMRFHSMSIAIAIGIFLITLLPCIIFNMQFNVPQRTFKLTPIFKNKTPAQATKQDTYIIDDDNWEIASESDILSGQHHID